MATELDFGSKEEQAYQAAREFSKLFYNTFDKKRHESLGHSSLMRYYRQNIAPNQRKNSVIPPKMLAQCNPLGWTGATGTGTVLTYNNWRFSTYDRHHEGSGINCRLQGSMVA
ncbi:hypothetical protein ScPMuIL_010740 [Solemya velum]